MKSLLGALLLGIGLPIAATAAEGTNTVPAVQAQLRTEAPPAKRPLATSPRGAGQLQRRVTYGGFLADLSKTDRPKLLNLRAPVTPHRDRQNLYVDPDTGRPRGIVFFAIRF